MVVGDTSGAPDNEFTIERSAVDAEVGLGNFVYRADDGRILTTGEAIDELTAEMSQGPLGLSPEYDVIDGGDVEELISESGIYATLEVEGRLVTQYSDGQSHWTNDQLREEVFPISDHGDLSFEDWRTAQVGAGNLTESDVLQYVGYEDEDADHETVIAERLIVD